MKTRIRPRELWEQYMGSCVHFTGLINDTCEAGIAYTSVRETPEGRPYAYPCLRRDRGDDWPNAERECPSARFMTEAEAKAKDAEVHERIRQHFAEMESGICPNCHQPMSKRQVGRCVYAEPCGHRLYQGKA